MMSLRSSITHTLKLLCHGQDCAVYVFVSTGMALTAGLSRTDVLPSIVAQTIQKYDMLLRNNGDLTR
jgi:hypothetical protein